MTAIGAEPIPTTNRATPKFIQRDFVFRREYRGNVKGLVLDWSGTTADKYVIAPAVVFVEVFKNQGVAGNLAAISGASRDRRSS